MSADATTERAQRPLDAGEAENPHHTGLSGPKLTTDHGNHPSVDLASDPLDELPGAPEINVSQARAEVQQWRHDGIPLHGLHQIAIALDREVERLLGFMALQTAAGIRACDERDAALQEVRVIEDAARDAYTCLKLAGAQHTPQGTRLAEVLKIKHEPQAPEDNDAA